MSFDLKIRNGDIFYKAGAVGTVKDEDKLVQSLIKLLLTPVRTASLRPDYGTALGGILGSVMPDYIYLTKIQESITSAIKYMIMQQRAQSLYQYVSPGEQIRELLQVRVERNPSDTRQIEVRIAVRAGSGNVIERVFTIAPGAEVAQRKNTGDTVAERGEL